MGVSTLALSLAAAGGGCGREAAAPATVRLLTHDSFRISEEARAAFTNATGLTLEVLQAGDAGSMVNQAILSAGNPVADVMFGVDTTFLSRALEADLFTAYEAPGLPALLPGLTTDPEHRVTPIDYGDVCLNYDKAAFVTTSPPRSLADLTDPAYRGMLVGEDPGTSSPGLAFLLATIATFGEDGASTWQDYTLLDSGQGRKLERFGPVTLIRPEVQATWSPAMSRANWGAADAVFEPAGQESGRWQVRQPIPARWEMGYAGLRVLIRRSFD